HGLDGALNKGMGPLLGIAPTGARSRRFLLCLPTDVDAMGSNLLGRQRRDDRSRGYDELPMAVERLPQIFGAQHAAGPAQDFSIGSHQSHTPKTIQRTGEALTPTNSRAPAPSFDKITRS